MARYYVGNGTNWSSTASWATSSGGASGAAAPTNTDDVFLDANSPGNITIDVASSCQSLTCTGFTHTLIHTPAITLSIGSSTAGAGNVALLTVSTMVYSIGSLTTSLINFISTSTTVQTITTGGISLPSWTINGAGSNYQLADSNTVAATSTVTLTAGTFNTNGQTCSWGTFSSNNSNTRSMSLGSSAITITGTAVNAAWFIPTVTGLTFSAGTSTITLNGANSGIQPGSLNYYNMVFAGYGLQAVYSTLYCVNFTRTGTASLVDALRIGTAITCSGTITINGNSTTNRLLIYGSTLGTAATLSAATVNVSNTDFLDITGAGAGSWNLAAISGNSGDCGGNSNITFTTAATQTWSGTSGGNWSANAWTSRVPLPQDNVVIASAFAASQTIVSDIPRIGKNITWTGTTGAPTWNIPQIANSANTTYLNMIFGSMTLATGMASVTGSGFLQLSGRGSYTVTSAGISYVPGIGIVSFGGSYTLQDTLFLVGSLQHLAGTFNTNNNNVSCALYVSASVSPRTLTLGTSIVTLNAFAAVTTVWSLTATSYTLNALNATFVIGAVSSYTRTFAGAGLSYGTLTYNIAGSTGSLIITGANSFANLNFSDSSNVRTLTLPASTTTTITGGFNVYGIVGKLITINSSTNGTAATVSKVNGIISSNYLSIQDSTASGGASWYAGNHSTNLSNTTGWIFSSPPIVNSNMALFR